MYFDERNNYFDYVNEKKKNEFENEYNLNDAFKDMSFDITNININNYRSNNTLYSPYEGLNKGNMFESLYKPYKNYEFKIVVSGKREELLLKIQSLSFAIGDLKLYLDIYPNNTKTLELYKKYVSDYKVLKEQYESEYGLLCSKDVKSNTEFTWVNDPWPWSQGGNNV